MEILEIFNDILWSYVIVALLVACAFYFTIRLRGVQFCNFRDMLKVITDRSQGEEGKSISPFQAFAVALSSRVGTGNLAGVASAIFIGGPGAVFWMWVMALLGSATAFVESTLAQLYKRKGEDSFYGGPAYYMQYGLGKRWMGVLFAVLITITFGLANQVVQSNTLYDAVVSATGVSKTWLAVAVTTVTLIVVFGGIQRISRLASVLVPFMAVGYLLLSLYIIMANITAIPAVLKLIVESAFGVQQAVGGAVGAAILNGVKRGLFSNEAGEGSAPNAAATASTSHPVKQGLLQALGVFVDTIVVCSCTAFIILISGLYAGDLDGILLTGAALEQEVGAAGRWFITVAILLFAYSTIIANYFYGETNIRFIAPEKKWGIQAFRLFTGGVILAGAYVTLQQAWTMVDICMGLMTLCNLVAIVLLFKHVLKLLRDYHSQRREGKDPVFHRDTMPEIADDLDCWE